MNADVTRLVRSPGALEAALVSFLEAKTSGSAVPVERRVFLTMAEAVEFSGLPASFLRQLIATGKLKALKTGAGWRVSRAGIEGLSDSITEVPGELTEHELRDLETNRNRRRGPVTTADPDLA
jgi:excisionase family DNA binding protein